MSLTLLLLHLVLGADDFALRVEGCARVDEAQLRRLLALELRQSAGAPVRVALTCDATEASVRAWVEDRSVEQRYPLRETPTVALARVLALAVVETIAAARSPPPALPTPPPPPPVATLERSRRAVLSAAALAEYGGAALGGARLQALVHLLPSLALRAELSWARGGSAVALGSTRAEALEGALGLAWVPRLGRFRFPMGAALRLGSVWLSATPLDGTVTAGAVQGLRFGPALFAGALFDATDWLVLGLDVLGGWQLRGVRGTIEGSPPLALEGAWVTGALSVGFAW